jgi:hypothetical protein
MVTSNHKAPPMSRTTHYEQIGSPRPSYPYASSPPLSVPTAAHVNPGYRSPAFDYRTDPARAQSSISSGESGSSAESDIKAYIPVRPYRQNPQAQGAMPSVLAGRNSHIESRSGTRVSGISHGHREMIEDHSAVFRYIQEEEAEEVTPNDHALWILVCSILGKQFPKLCWY